MPDFFQTVLGGIFLAAMGYPYVVANKFPDKFPLVEKAVTWMLDRAALAAFFLSMGYDMGRQDQMAGRAFTSRDTTNFLIVTALLWVVGHAYIMFLNFVVAAWNKEARDKKQD